MQPETGLLAAYYGLPSLSTRDVWYHHWARNDPGFRSRDFMCNQNHPNYLGHQCAADLHACQHPPGQRACSTQPLVPCFLTSDCL